jgi:hypothetical protein
LGATITSYVSGVKKLPLVATKTPGYGNVEIYLGAALLKRVNLTAQSPRPKSLIPIAAFSSARGGTLRIVVVSSEKTVRIEGHRVATG